MHGRDDKLIAATSIVVGVLFAVSALVRLLGGGHEAGDGHLYRASAVGTQWALAGK